MRAQRRGGVRAAAHRVHAGGAELAMGLLPVGRCRFPLRAVLVPLLSFSGRGPTIPGRAGYPVAWTAPVRSGLGPHLFLSDAAWYFDLLRAGRSLNTSRKIALGVRAAVMPVAYFVTKTPVELAIVLFSIAFFGQQSWFTC